MVDKTITDLDDGGTGRPGDLYAVDRSGRTLKVLLPYMVNVYILSPSNLTIPLIAASSYATTISAIAGLKVASGSLTLTVSINGVAVTGLSNLSVTSTAQNPIATALNAVAINARLTIVISNMTNAVGLEFTLY